MATPTKNMNDGWIKSQNEHPRQSTCSSWPARNAMTGLVDEPEELARPPNIAAPPEAIASITRPRYASMETDLCDKYRGSRDMTPLHFDNFGKGTGKNAARDLAR